MASTVDLAFLEPWHEALRESVSLRDTAHDISMEVSVSCGTSAYHHAIVVLFPADEESRRRRPHLQRVREAIELFSFLVIVSRSAFTQVLADILGEDRAHDDQCSVTWRFRMVGKISPQDPVTTQSPVSWGSLLGIPDIPREYSPEFRAAVQKVEALCSVAVDHTRSSLHWLADNGDIYASAGGQKEYFFRSNADVSRQMEGFFETHVPPLGQIRVVNDSSRLLELWCEQLEALAVLEVAEAYVQRASFEEVYLAHFNDDDDYPETIRQRLQQKLQLLLADNVEINQILREHDSSKAYFEESTEQVDHFKAHCMELFMMLCQRCGFKVSRQTVGSAISNYASILNQVRRSKLAGNAGIYRDYSVSFHPSSTKLSELVVALARTKITSLELGFHDRTRAGQRLKMNVENVGFLLGTLICGEQICRLNQARRGLRLPFKYPSLCDLGVNCREVTSSVFMAVCSAIAESPTITELGFSMGESDFGYLPTTTTHWSWLVYALFSKMALSFVNSLIIDGVSISSSDVVTAAAVLKASYPQPVPVSDDFQQPLYGFVDVEEGTQLRPVEEIDDADDDITFAMARKRRCRALHCPGKTSKYADIVVPGHGTCRVELGDSVNQFIPDPPKSTSPLNSKIASLWLSVIEVESTTVLMDMLALIGGRGLHSLVIELKQNAVAVDLNALAAACPNLLELTLEGVDLSVSADDALTDWPIQKMTFNRSNSIHGLAGCLGNHMLRMTRELSHLEITLPFGSHPRDEEIELLRMHNNECLRVVDRKFPVRAKAAFLSAIHRFSSAPSTAKAIAHLDSDVMSSIFKMAATPKKRLARIH